MTTTWQDIGTAPRGVRVLGYWPGNQMHTGETDGNEWFPACEHESEWAMPTHWMPLPSPPSKEGE